jgi:hypothetical protein
MVDGYVRKRVTLRISKGLRAVALAAGISRRVLCDTRVIFITIIAIYITLAEKIGTPLISFVWTRDILVCIKFKNKDHCDTNKPSIREGRDMGYGFRVGCFGPPHEP